MKKVIEGIVIELRGEFALVSPSTEPVCSCICHDSEMGFALVEAKNEVNALIGDRVISEVAEEGMAKTAFILFILPIILVFMSAVAGYNLSLVLNLNSSLIAIIGTSLFFIFSIIISDKAFNIRTLAS